jgi:hypothetical protein
MTRPTFVSMLARVVPPWLQRTQGAKLLGAFGDVLDDHVQLLADSALAPFPRSSEPSALGYIGRQRRIRRGPAELADSYARRLRTWWDDHRTRGGPHALLRQYHEYLFDYAPGQIDVVYQLGTRFVADEVTGAITRSDIVWDGDGQGPGPWIDLGADAATTDTSITLEDPIVPAAFPFPFAIEIDNGTSYELASVAGRGLGETPVYLLDDPLGANYPAATSRARRVFQFWARVWIFVHLGSSSALTTEAGADLLTESGETLAAFSAGGFLLDELTTEAGSSLTTEADEVLAGIVPIWGGVFDAYDDQVWSVVPREWSAAHVQRTTIVLLYGVGECWGYPQPMGTWDEDESITWDQDTPYTVVVED